MFPAVGMLICLGHPLRGTIYILFVHRGLVSGLCTRANPSVEPSGYRRRRTIHVDCQKACVLFESDSSPLMRPRYWPGLKQ